MSTSRNQAIALAATLLFTTTARADERKPERLAAATAADELIEPSTIVSTRTAKRPRPYITHANVGVVAMNWTGPLNNTPGKMLTIADRQTVVQMFGAGRFITPSLRVTLSVQLAEAVAGAPANDQIGRAHV